MIDAIRAISPEGVRDCSFSGSRDSSDEQKRCTNPARSKQIDAMAIRETASSAQKRRYGITAGDNTKSGARGDGRWNLPVAKKGFGSSATRGDVGVDAKRPQPLNSSSARGVNTGSRSPDVENAGGGAWPTSAQKLSASGTLTPEARQRLSLKLSGEAAANVVARLSASGAAQPSAIGAANAKRRPRSPNGGYPKGGPVSNKVLHNDIVTAGVVSTGASAVRQSLADVFLP